MNLDEMPPYDHFLLSQGFRNDGYRFYLKPLSDRVMVVSLWRDHAFIMNRFFDPDIEFYSLLELELAVVYLGLRPLLPPGPEV